MCVGVGTMGVPIMCRQRGGDRGMAGGVAGWGEGYCTCLHLLPPTSVVAKGWGWWADEDVATFIVRGL